MKSKSQINMRWHLLNIICQRFSYFPIIPIFCHYHFHNAKGIHERSFHCIQMIEILTFFSELCKQGEGWEYKLWMYVYNILSYHVTILCMISIFWTPTHTTSPVLSQSVTDGACTFVRSKCVNTRCFSST